MGNNENKPMKRIMLVEDQSILLDSLSMALETKEDFEVVAKIMEPDLALMVCEKHKPNVVLMDICANDDIVGFYSAKKIKEIYPLIKVIMITGMPEITFIKYAKDIGADGFLYKSMSLDEIVESIRKIFLGQKIFPKVEEFDINVESDNFKMDMFTSREIDILRLLCSGYAKWEIADKLFISENTVKAHQRKILNKTGFDKISKLVCYVTKKGFIHPKM